MTTAMKDETATADEQQANEGPVQAIECKCRLVGITPLGFSAPIATQKEPSENHDDFEKRTWRERMRVNADGQVYLVPAALRFCLLAAAKYRTMKVPGHGMKTYTKFFASGVFVFDPLIICDENGTPVDPKQVPGNRIFVPSDGVSGSGKRVWKTFPTLEKWSTDATIHVVEPMLAQSPDVIKMYMEVAGLFCGLGQYRPSTSGWYGRSKLVDWTVTPTG